VADKYLLKKESRAEIPFLVRVAYNYHLAKLGKVGAEFQQRTLNQETELEKLESPKHIQKKLDS